MTPPSMTLGRKDRRRPWSLRVSFLSFSIGERSVSAIAEPVTDEFDWAKTIEPTEKLAVTPYAYVVPQGDQIWLNFINLFVDTIKLDGRLLQAAKRHKLDPIVAP